MTFLSQPIPNEQLEPACHMRAADLQERLISKQHVSWTHHAALLSIVAPPLALRAQGRVAFAEGHRIPKILDRVEVILRGVVNAACQEEFFLNCNIVTWSKTLAKMGRQSYWSFAQVWVRSLAKEMKMYWVDVSIPTIQWRARQFKSRRVFK